jgi:hypothetical protein
MSESSTERFVEFNSFKDLPQPQYLFDLPEDERRIALLTLIAELERIDVDCSIFLAEVEKVLEASKQVQSTLGTDLEFITYRAFYQAYGLIAQGDRTEEFARDIYSNPEISGKYISGALLSAA